MPTSNRHGTDPAASPSASSLADPLVHQATGEDAARLADWLDGCAPLPVLARRHRRDMLDALLARPESAPCVMVEQGGLPLALLTAQLSPRLDLAGLAAIAAEWWCLPGGHKSGAMLTLCADWLVDWCRAHGVRHLLLSPGMAALAPALAAGSSPLDCGLLHRDLAPAAKLLV